MMSAPTANAITARTNELCKIFISLFSFTCCKVTKNIIKTFFFSKKTISHASWKTAESLLEASSNHAKACLSSVYCYAFMK